MRKLESKQRRVLEALELHGHWYEDCGWVWDHVEGTRKVMQALAKRGSVNTSEIPPAPCTSPSAPPRLRYEISDQGRLELDEA